MKLEQVKYTGNHPVISGQIGMIKDCDDPNFYLFRPLKSKDWFRIFHFNICNTTKTPKRNRLLERFSIRLMG